MSDFLAITQVVAAWLALSLALWWGRRRWIRSGQNARLAEAARACDLTRRGHEVFETIRTPQPMENPPSEAKAYLRAETNALLKRIHEQGPFFDSINTLRVHMQAAHGIDDHEGLSEILHLRRDLWAASEIVLVENPAQFGRTFAGEGVFERFHAEAVSTLFRFPGDPVDAGEDVIGLRLTLAVREAEDYAAALERAVAEARARDRLPRPSELAAYPLGWLRALPRIARSASIFAGAFFAHASLMARRLGESEAVSGGRARMRRIGEDWPQRLSEGFQRASGTARENVAALRGHYDFLAAAHDFRARYEQLLERAPEMGERGRQFIARLELAERSERLRLTSTNAAIWAARALLQGLAHVIAYARRVEAQLQDTAAWSLAEAALAPPRTRGRGRPAFRSYQLALTANGFTEARPEQDFGEAAPAVARRTAHKAALPASRAGKVSPTKRRAARPAPEPQARKRSAGRLIRRAATIGARLIRPMPYDYRSGRETDRQAGPEAAPAAAVPGADAFPGRKSKRAPRAKADKAASKSATLPVSAAAGGTEHPAERPSRRFKLFGAGLFSAKTAALPTKADDAAVKAELELAENAPAPERAMPEKSKTPAKPAKTEKKAETPPPEAPPARTVRKRQTSVEMRADPPKTAHPEPAAPTPAALPEAAPAPEHVPVVAVESPAPARTEAERSAGPRFSFLRRLFRRPETAATAPAASEIMLAPAMSAADNAPEAFEPLPSSPDEEPAISLPRLMEKLSSLEEAALDGDTDSADTERNGGAPDEPADDPQTDDTDEMGPLTESLIELQSRVKPAAPQIRAFPWLRG